MQTSTTNRRSFSRTLWQSHGANMPTAMSACGTSAASRGDQATSAYEGQSGRTADIVGGPSLYTEQTCVPNRTLFDADLMDFREVEVRREWRNIDILIDLPDDVVTVENKVDSSEHARQLRRYKDIADGEFGAKRKHFVYLTPFGADAAEVDDQVVYINYSYSQIGDIIENILSLYHESICDASIRLPQGLSIASFNGFMSTQPCQTVVLNLRFRSCILSSEILRMTQTGINVRVFPDIHVALPVSCADRWERAAFLEPRLPHQRTDTGPRDSGLQRFAPRPESDPRALWRPPVPANPT